MMLYYGYPTASLLSQNISKMIQAVKQEPPATQHFALIEQTLKGVARVSVEYNLIELGMRLYPPDSLSIRFTRLTAATAIGVSKRLIDKLLKTLSDDQTSRLAEYLESSYFVDDGAGYLVTPITAALDAELRSVIDKIRHLPFLPVHTGRI